MSQIATHDGKVISTAKGVVSVEMHVVSACSSCKAHEKCAFVDKAEKIIEVETEDWREYQEGDRVIVSVNESLGLEAVLLAYILPALIIIGAVIVLSIITESEAITATVPIILIAIYFLLLYKLRDRLQRKFSFGIAKEC